MIKQRKQHGSSSIIVNDIQRIKNVLIFLYSDIQFNYKDELMH